MSDQLILDMSAKNRLDDLGFDKICPVLAFGLTDLAENQLEWELETMKTDTNNPASENDRRSFKEIQTSQSKCDFEYLCLLTVAVINYQLL